MNGDSNIIEREALEGNEFSVPEPLEASPEADSSRQEIENMYTVDGAINKIGFGPFQIFITVFCGLLWLADAMEFMLLSVLSPAVKCQWNLSNFEEAFISSLVFLGFLLGGFFWGVLFDAVGRKTGLFIVNIVILVCGVLSAVQVSGDDRKMPGYPWLLITRFGVGFGAGGSGQVVTYYAEFLPVKGRGILLVLIDIWWAIGTMFGAALSLAVLRDGGLNWHWLLGLATIPLLLTLFMFPFVPESARYYLVKGKADKAQKVMKRVAWFNCKELPPGRIVSQEENEKIGIQESVVIYSEGTITLSDRSSYDVTTTPENNVTDTDNAEMPLIGEETDTALVTPVIGKQWKLPPKLRSILHQLSSLFTNGMWKTTVLLLFLWLGAAWLYYGIVLLTTTLLRYDPHCGVESVQNWTNFSNDSSDTCEGTELHTSDYVKILWTTAAELPGILITLFIIDLLGRKLTMALEFIVSMIGFLLLFICASDVVLTIFFFIIRAFTTGVFQTIYVYTPEIYPTASRAVGLGVCTAAARVGAIATPYVAQVLLHVNDYATLSLYAGSCLVLAVLAIMLPVETKGRALKDNK